MESRQKLSTDRRRVYLSLLMLALYGVILQFFISEVFRTQYHVVGDLGVVFIAVVVWALAVRVYGATMCLNECWSQPKSEVRSYGDPAYIAIAPMGMSPCFGAMALKMKKLLFGKVHGLLLDQNSSRSLRICVPGLRRMGTASLSQLMTWEWLGQWNGCTSGRDSAYRSG